MVILIRMRHTLKSKKNPYYLKYLMMSAFSFQIPNIDDVTIDDVNMNFSFR